MSYQIAKDSGGIMKDLYFITEIFCHVDVYIRTSREGKKLKKIQ